MFAGTVMQCWRLLCENNHANKRTGTPFLTELTVLLGMFEIVKLGAGVNRWSRDGDTPFWSMFSLGDQAVRRQI